MIIQQEKRFKLNKIYALIVLAGSSYLQVIQYVHAVDLNNNLSNVEIQNQDTVLPSAKDKTALAVNVTPSQVTSLAPIIITATRTPLPQQQASASVAVISAAQLQNQQLQVNLSESLVQVPGIQVQNRQNYAQDLQISMRGFGARSAFGVRGVRLYVDDIPATMPDGQGQTSNIDLTSAQQIEVLTGPLSALYGNSSGGTILVNTEQGTYPPSVTIAAAASDATYRFNIKAQGAGKDDTAPQYVLSRSRFDTDGYRQHSAATKDLTNAKLTWQLNDDSQIKLILNQVDIKADDPLGVTRDMWQGNPKQVVANAFTFNTRKTVAQTQGGLVYEKPLSDTQTARAVLYYGQRDTVQYQAIPVAAQANPKHAGGVIDLGRDYYGVDLRWTLKDWLPNSTLVAGLSYDNLQEQRQGFENFTGSSAKPVQLGIKGQLRRDERNQIDNLDPYLQAAWQFLPQWRLDAGLRYSTVHFESDDYYVNASNPDDSGEQDYQKLLPSLALNWQPKAGVNIYTAYARGFETPTFNEISYRADGNSGLNTTLQPASSDNFELGVKNSLYGGLITAVIFHTVTKNEIIAATNDNGRSSFRNAGTTRRQGLELAWTKKLAKNFALNAAYTYLDATYRDTIAKSNMNNPSEVKGSELVLKRGNQLAGVAKQSAYAALNWNTKSGWLAGAELRHLDKIFVNDSNSDAAPAYTIGSVKTGYQWQFKQNTLQSFVRIDNLFDRKYVGSVIVNEANNRFFEPASGRTWTAGLSMTFQ